MGDHREGKGQTLLVSTEISDGLQAAPSFNGGQLLVTESPYKMTVQGCLRFTHKSTMNRNLKVLWYRQQILYY